MATTVSGYGDYDIEDAWDAIDDDEHLLSNIERRIARLEAIFASVIVNNNADVLEQFVQRLQPINRGRWEMTEADQARLDRIYDDIQFMRERRG